MIDQTGHQAQRIHVTWRRPNLVIVGDVAPAIFAAQHEMSASDAVRWVAYGPLRAVARQCAAAMRSPDVAWTTDAEVARDELSLVAAMRGDHVGGRCAANAAGEYDSDDDRRICADALDAMLLAEQAGGDGVAEASAVLYDRRFSGGGLMADELGRVVSERVICARGICRVIVRTM